MRDPAILKPDSSGPSSNRPARFQALNDHYLILLVLAAALFFRLHRMDFLLPYFAFTDERDVVRAALNILKTGDWNPHFFWYGSFPIYWTTLWYGLVLGAKCWISGGMSTIGECIKGFEIYDQGFLLFYLGRITSIVFGLGTIYLTWLLGRRLFGRGAGLGAALFLAISPFHIFFSQVFKVDMSLLFWILLTVHFSLNIYERGAAKDYIWAGLFTGLALSTKYNFFAFAPVLLACGFKEGWRGLISSKLVLSGYVAVMVFLVTCPYAILDFAGFQQQLYVQMEINQKSIIYFRTDPASFFYRHYVYELFIVFPFFFSPGLYPAGLIGLGGFFQRDRSRCLILISFPVLYFLFSGGISNLVMPQYQLPYAPFVFILGGAGIFSWLKSPGVKRTLGGLLLGISLLFFASDLWLPHFQGHMNVYREAGEWINREIPKDRTVLTYFWVYPSTRHFGFRREQVASGAGGFSRQILEETQPDYIITTGSSIFRDPRFSGSFRGYIEARDWISRSGKYSLIKRFIPSETWEWFSGKVYREMKGFEILVYRRE